jgi:transcription antitermination protein NusB
MSLRNMSVNKHKLREVAMQTLYLWDSQGQCDQPLARQSAESAGLDPAHTEQVLAMAGQAWEFHASADEWLNRVAPQWPVGRQAAVDRAILRLAVWELTHTTTPPKVVLDEAIELGKEFSTENSPAFINGVLDAVLREHQTLTRPPESPQTDSHSPTAPSPEPQAPEAAP